MSTLSQYAIDRKIKMAYQTAVVLAILFVIPPIIDFFRGEGERWMMLPIFYSLIAFGCAYGIYMKKMIVGIFLCVTLPFYYLIFMKQSISFTLTMIIALYLLLDGIYAIYKFHKQKT